jgi:hypothetical protein
MSVVGWRLVDRDGVSVHQAMARRHSHGRRRRRRTSDSSAKRFVHETFVGILTSSRKRDPTGGKMV